MTPQEAQQELAAIRAAAGNLGEQIESNPDYIAAFGGRSLSEVENLSAITNPALATKRLFILSGTIDKLQKVMDEAAAKGTSVFINGVPATSSATALGGVTLSGLHGINIGPDPAYVARLEAIANPPVSAPGPSALPLRAQTAPSVIPAVQPRQFIDPASADPSVVPAVPAANAVIPPNNPLAARAPIAPVAPRVTAPQQAAAPATPRATAPLMLGKITPQTTVLDLIVNGIQTSTDSQAATLKAAATAKLTEELSAKQPALANNPQAMAAAVQQGLPGSIRGLILDLSKDKSVQQKIAGGFLDAMRAQSPGAEQSGFYQNLKRLSSNEQTFGAFLNTNMLDGISKDYENRVRAENGGKVPATIMDAVANNIMRVKPEIKKYNDAVGQDICDFVRNPEISRERLLNSPNTQAQIRSGLAQYKKDHPFQTFFAGLVGINMEQRAQQEAASRIAKEVKNKNYSGEIQRGFIDEFNRRTGQEMRGEQLENVRAFTRHLSQLPYSRFIQEDITPRRMSAIILGIERPGEGQTPTRHLIPQQLISRNQSPHVNVAAAQTQPDAQQRQQPARPPAMHAV